LWYICMVITLLENKNSYVKYREKNNGKTKPNKIKFNYLLWSSVIHRYI